jgi:hypothetical protein
MNKREENMNEVDMVKVVFFFLGKLPFTPLKYSLIFTFASKV